jgi:hypothetical protein
LGRISGRNYVQFMVSGVTGTAAGKQRRGIAMMNQRMVTLSSSAGITRPERFHSHVADVSNLALVKGTSLDLLPSSEEREGDRDTTSASKTDDGNTEESVESSDRSKVDTGQGHLDGGVEEEGVQGHFETLGHFAPNIVSGNTTVSGEATLSVGRSADQRC